MKALLIVEVLITMASLVMVTLGIIKLYVYGFRAKENSVNYFLSDEKRGYMVAVKIFLWCQWLKNGLNFSYTVDRIAKNWHGFIDNYVLLTSLPYYLMFLVTSTIVFAIQNNHNFAWLVKMRIFKSK